MGNSFSAGSFSQDILDDYVELTYLSKSEILRIFKLLDDVDPGRLRENLQHRFSREQVEKILPQIRYCPFRHSVYRVFSSEHDEKLSFEDVLDLCSAFSEECPIEVRAVWAFSIFDFDGDDQLSLADLIEAVRCLTSSDRLDGQTGISAERAEQVARMILKEMDLTQMGSISCKEFVYFVSRMPDFVHTFHFKV